MNRKLHLLLIEDDPEARQVIQKALEDDGLIKVEAVDNLLNGALVLRDLPTYAAVIDLSVPDASVRDAVAGIRAVSPHIPIVAITGGGEEEMRAAVRAGANLVLTREEVSRPDFVRRLREAVVKLEVEAMYAPPAESAAAVKDLLKRMAARTGEVRRILNRPLPEAEGVAPNAAVGARDDTGSSGTAGTGATTPTVRRPD